MNSKTLLPFAHLLTAACALLFVHAGRAATYDVVVDSNEFRPSTITIAPGDTVRWTAVAEDHTVTADDGSFDTAAQGPVTMPVDATFSFTFTTAGSFRYYCAIHGAPNGNGMSGLVRVVVPGQNAAPATPVNTSPAAGATGISTSPTLLASAFSDSDGGDTHASSQWLVRTVSNGQVVLDTGETTANKTSLSLADLESSTAYEWQVRYRDDRGEWSAYSTATQFTTVASTSVAGTGLLASYGSYIPKKDAAKILATQVDATVNFDWKLGKPQKKTPANNFFVRWEGTVLPEFSERYRFRVRAGGGVRLFINNQPVIDDWFAASFPLYRNGAVELEAGVPVSIRLEYFDTAGTASVQLRWSSPSIPVQVIPQARLFPPLP